MRVLLSGIAGLVLALLLLDLVPATAATPRAAAEQTLQSLPTVHAVRVIGYTVRHRPIRAFRIGDPSSTVKVVLVGAIHGDETGPSRILLNLIDGAPVAGADIWVIPYFNRDGVARHTRTNAHGVDLNRNFPFDWIRLGGGNYSGSRPASEPETRALIRFLKVIRPRFVVGLHQPLYGVDVSYSKTRAFALRLARGLRLPRKVFTCVSGCHGTMTEWFNHTFPGGALTVEYGRSMTTTQVLRTGPTGMLAAVFARRG